MYRLRWQESVTRELLQATASADSAVGERIMSAISEIETVLINAADTAGESREPGKRFLFNAPLGITFRVNARLREVVIVRARIHFPKR
jgi:hypothetical protein